VAHLNLGLSFSDLNKKREAVAILLDVPKISDDGTKDPLSHVTTQVSRQRRLVWQLMENSVSRFFIVQHTKTGKIYQTTTEYTT
jgi:predicted phosphohydrolase